MFLLFCFLFSGPSRLKTKLPITKGSIIKVQFRNLNLEHMALWSHSHRVKRKCRLSGNLGAGESSPGEGEEEENILGKEE